VPLTPWTWSIRKIGLWTTLILPSVAVGAKRAKTVRDFHVVGDPKMACNRGAGRVMPHTRETLVIASASKRYTREDTTTPFIN
jgi:hypothetical protein